MTADGLTDLEGSLNDEVTTAGRARIRSSCVFPCLVCPRQDSNLRLCLAPSAVTDEASYHPR